MRVYLAAAMTNPNRDLPVIAAILACLEHAGHDVPTRHVADPQGRALDAELSDRELARRDLDWIAGCDALVAEVSTPSHGVGIEIGAATALGKPVLVLAREGIAVSRLLVGLTGVETFRYSGADDLARAVAAFLADAAADGSAQSAP